MTYSNKFVMSLLVNGIPQNELANGTVVIPFNTEYSLRFRNKNNVRAKVEFFIDGENCSDNGYVINANSVIDIKRHAKKDVGFKFVGLNSPEAIDQGKNGDNLNKIKGLIEARFYLEKNPYHPYYPCNQYNPYHYDWRRDLIGSVNNRGSDLEAKYCAFSCDVAQQSCNMPVGDLQDGCTVEGNVTGQYFTTTYFIPEEHYTTLTLFLQGFEEKNCVVKTKKLSDLEKENKKLRKKIAELENQKLKEKLDQLNGTIINEPV